MGNIARLLQRRKKALGELNELMSRPEHVIVIHYSCESFYDRPNGSSPRITSIAVANLHSAQANSFSIHQVAEKQGIPLASIEDHYDQLEKAMLDEFYDYVRRHADFKWLHWNMKSINYGFRAIAHRYRVLKGEPVEHHETDLVDLARLLHDIYGDDYIAHPRLQKLVEKNKISAKDFLPGADEAAAFERKEYVKLHFSTLRKVDILASIAQRADRKSLLTDSTWRTQYGLYPMAVSEWLSEHWVVYLLGAVFAIVGFFAALVQLWDWFH